MSLDTALKNFADAFAAYSANFGTIEYRVFQPIVEPIPIGPALQEYFGRLRLSDKPQVGGRLLLMLFTLDDLETCQQGWRWIRKNGGPVIEDPTWNKHWIVIADRHGDAIVVDDSTAGGAGTFNYEVYDEDFNPIPEFLDAVSANARRVLGPGGEAGFMEFFFG